MATRAEIATLRENPATMCRRQALPCEDCAMWFSAQSYDALKAAIREHVQYVNTAKDRESDGHFEEHRLDRLMPEGFPND